MDRLRDSRKRDALLDLLPKGQDGDALYRPSWLPDHIDVTPEGCLFQRTDEQGT